MAEKAEFLRLYQEGKTQLERAMDKDQFAQHQEAIDFYIHVCFFVGTRLLFSITQTYTFWCS